MKAYEAVVGIGTRIHAVLLEKQPIAYAERRDKIYVTACGHRVRGSSVYRTDFLKRDPYYQCGNCMRRIPQEARDGAATTG